MLAAFDVSHGGSNSGGIAAEDPSRSEHVVRSNVDGSGPEERQNSTDLLSECCDTSRCEAGSCCDHSSHSDSDCESCRLRQVSAVIESHADSVTHEQRITHPEAVESVNSCDHAGKGQQLTAEAVKAEAPPQSVAVLQRRSTGRLSERIKLTLQQNAKLDTPTRLNRLSAVLEKYDVRHDVDVTNDDPFSGLPDKVRQLLETQRSITELYRMYVTLFFLFLFDSHSLPPQGRFCSFR